MATYSRFSDVSEEVKKIILLGNSIRRLKTGNSPLHEFKTSKLLNELMSVRTELKVTNDNLVMRN